MQSSFNGELDLTQVILKVLERNYGFELVYILLVIGAIVACTYFIAKSGVVSGIRDFSDHRRKKNNDRITEEERLLKDEFLKEYISEIAYHVKVSKLENYLNIKNKDLDLLSYIISCRDRAKAVRLFKIGKHYLEKDVETNLYKLKCKYTEEKLKSNSLWGKTFYFLINMVGAGPFIFLNFVQFIYKNESTELSNSLFIIFFLFFIVLLIFSMYVLWGFLKPEAAQNFLKLEKISNKNINNDTLAEAA